MTRFSKIPAFYLLCAIALGWTLLGAPARAELAVSPLRAVIDDDRRAATFIVSNPTRRIIDGRASWLDLGADEVGYRQIDADARAALSAAPYLTVSPARFRLEPGDRATITVRLKAGLTPPRGEKRSHLLIETDAARTLLRQARSGGLQVDLATGLSAPVLLRGAGDADASIAGAKLLRGENGALEIETVIEPKGAHSAYGELVVSFAPADGRPASTLARRANVAAYLDAKTRRFKIPLGVHALEEGELTINFNGAQEFAGQRFDRRRFSIAPPAID